MGDQSVNKVSSQYSPRGKMGIGDSYLHATVGIRAARSSPSLTQRAYETVGYVIRGRANLKIEGQILSLTVGDSWIVPKGSSHCYEILEPFTPGEVTTPPAQVHGSDE